MRHVVHRALFAVFVVLVTCSFCSPALAQEERRGRRRGEKKEDSPPPTPAPAPTPTPTPAPDNRSRTRGNREGRQGDDYGAVERQPVQRHREEVRDEDRREDRWEARQEQRRRERREIRRREMTRAFLYEEDFVGTPYHEERYRGLGKHDHVLIPVKIPRASQYFDVLDAYNNNRPAQPHFKITAIVPQFPPIHDVYWTRPYSPKSGTHTYRMPRQRRLTTCDDGSPCYDYWEWVNATITLTPDPRPDPGRFNPDDDAGDNQPDDPGSYDDEPPEE